MPLSLCQHHRAQGRDRNQMKLVTHYKTLRYSYVTSRNWVSMFTPDLIDFR